MLIAKILITPRSIEIPSNQPWISCPMPLEKSDLLFLRVISGFMLVNCCFHRCLSFWCCYFSSCDFSRFMADHAASALVCGLSGCGDSASFKQEKIIICCLAGGRCGRFLRCESVLWRWGCCFLREPCLQ